VLVAAPGDRGEVGEPGIADGAGDLGIREGIEADVDGAALADEWQPVEDGAVIGEVAVVGCEEPTGLAAGELLQKREQALGSARP
jgi:hypothetical protein